MATLRVANIGPRGCVQRRWVGLAALALGIAVLAVLWGLELGRAPRLVLLLPFWLGALGVSQARHTT